MRQLRFEPVRFSNGEMILIDQRKLPGKLCWVRCSTVRQTWLAIRDMIVRGAPAIGVAAAYGVYLGVGRHHFKTTAQLLKQLRKSCNELKMARPTAVNLAWAVERIWQKANGFRAASVAALKKVILDEARKIHQEDIAICFSIGRHGLKLIRDGDSVLTYCNAGGLATTGYGTALAPFFEAKRKGKRFQVYACETRPWLQGARLTMWELKQYGVRATLLCDNMVGTLMSQEKITRVITGADRIVRNGDAANKIGTYSVACLAKMHRIPFYIAAPSSTFDFSKSHGCEIPIEQRNTDEITSRFKQPIVPAYTSMINPAFDVTPHELIAGFITEKGLLKPPYQKSFRKLQ